MKQIESPGDILSDILNSLDMSIQDLSDKSEIPYDNINAILYEEIKIDVEIANGLSKALNTTPEFWLYAQKDRINYYREQHKDEIYWLFVENHCPIDVILEDPEFDLYLPYLGYEEENDYDVKLANELVSEGKLISIKIYIPKTKETIEYLFPAGSKVLSKNEIIIKDLIE